MTSIKFRALTNDDYKLFFEALGEYGKDFGNIQQYIAQKSGNKNNNNKTSSNGSTNDPQKKKEQDKKEDDRKREQIRNFYNKIHTKLSQLIDYKVDDRIEKVNQELYLLINYGEIWKKHGFKFNDKTKKLLKELVYQGYTTYRFKNKNVRLRTPPCRALKRINEIGVDERVKVVTTRELPKDVIVEFHPATYRDWIRIQSISQNPRIRARLSIQKRISKILEFMDNKWNIQPDNIRLKPSAQHELKEVNITRVIPDNHLDLSLNAYINRLGKEKANIKSQNDTKDSSGNPCPPQIELSQSVLSTGSPDSSLAPEPSIAQARKHLNLLQSLTGSLENCDNSRTAHDVNDHLNHHHHDEQSQAQSTNPTITPALYDEDAIASAQDSRSVDFQIPKNVTLGEYFKMAGGDDTRPDPEGDELIPKADEDVVDEEEVCHDDSDLMRTHIMKLAEGWTRHDDSSTMTVGELYLAFKCPEKIILEYEIEKSPSEFNILAITNGGGGSVPVNDITEQHSKNIQENPSSNSSILKLLIAGSLSLAQIERRKQEHQHKLHDQKNCSKFKRRKGSNGQGPTMTLHDIEMTNQRVDDALRRLQTTRLTYKRARQ